MQWINDISFLWVLTLIGVIALIYAVRALVDFMIVNRDALNEYNYRHRENMIDKRLSKEGYIRAYKRVHMPRGRAYIAGGLSAILLLTAPALLLIQTILRQFWLLTGKDRAYEPGYLVWKFLIFFSLIGIWALIAYIIARFYHKHTPVSLQDEILKEIGQGEIIKTANNTN